MPPSYNNRGGRLREVQELRDLLAFHEAELFWSLALHMVLLTPLRVHREHRARSKPWKLQSMTQYHPPFKKENQNNIWGGAQREVGAWWMVVMSLHDGIFYGVISVEKLPLCAGSIHLPGTPDWYWAGSVFRGSIFFPGLLEYHSLNATPKLSSASLTEEFTLLSHCLSQGACMVIRIIALPSICQGFSFIMCFHLYPLLWSLQQC